MPTADSPDPVPEVEDLLRLLFDSDGPGLVRFLRRSFGPALVEQLPLATVPFAELAHQAALALARGGFIHQRLIERLAGERPGRVARINEAAVELGLATVAAPGPGTSVATAVATPEYLVQDTYRQLQAEQAIAQEFLAGPWKDLRRSLSILAEGGPEAVTAAAKAAVAWIDDNIARVRSPDLRNALGALRAQAEPAVLHPALLFLGALDQPRNQALQAHGRCIESWAFATDVELHHRALAQVSGTQTR